jgi:hypothetical protein
MPDWKQIVLIEPRNRCNEAQALLEKKGELVIFDFTYMHTMLVMHREHDDQKRQGSIIRNLCLYRSIHWLLFMHALAQRPITPSISFRSKITSKG